MIVGVGASRVRDLFQQAKTASPAIIFIDELDAIGRSRAAGGSNISGGHDEREQTLNQILTEMDGFDPRSGVIVLAATNRPEILDPALLRPGRFDRRVSVQPPDRAGREAILRVHTRSVPLDDEHQARCARLVHSRDGRRRSRQPRERGGAAGRAPQPQAGVQRGLLRLARADRARGRAQGDAVRGRPAAHRLPRGGPRDRRDAHPRRRPRAQGVDHPPWPGARRDVLRARRRSLQLRRGVPAGADQGRARRPRRRGDRARRSDHRRGIGHPAAHGDRASHGRSLGHEPRDRSDRSDPPRRHGTVAARRLGDLGGDPAGRGRGDQAHRRVRARRRQRAVGASIVQTSTRWPPRCSIARRSTRPTPTPPPVCHATRSRTPSRSPRASPDRWSYSGRRPAKPASGACQKRISSSSTSQHR